MCCSRLDGDINSQIRQKTLIDADVFILRSRAQMNYYSSALQLASLYRYSAHRFFILIQIAIAPTKKLRVTSKLAICRRLFFARC